MKRLAIVVKTSEGGLWLLPHIRAARSRGLSVAVVLPQADGRLRRAILKMVVDDSGVELHTSPFDFVFRRPTSVIAGLLRLRRLLRRLNPDVTIYHLYASALAVRLASLGLGSRRVHMVPGPLFLESPLIRLVERLLSRVDDTIVAGSAYTADRYRDIGVSVSRLSVVPYGVDTRHFAPNQGRREVNRSALGLSDGSFVAVMVAYTYAPKRLTHAGVGVKGHHTLLEAWVPFQRQHPDARLLIVGGGFDDAGERYRQHLIDSLPSSLNDLGIVWRESMDDVRHAYNVADVSVSPSISDNHGAVLEASAMAVPSIVSSAGALPETVTSESGWIFEVGSASALSERLASAYAAWRAGTTKTMGEAARTFVQEHFEQSVAAQRLLQIAFSTDSPQTLRIFSEARFHRGPSGEVLALDRASGAATWVRYKSAAPSVEVAARVGPYTTEANVPAGVPVYPLPYFQGVGQMLRRSPALVSSLATAVASADLSMFRLPGVVGLVGSEVARLRHREYAIELVGDPGAVLRTGIVGRIGVLAAPVVETLTRRAVRGASAARYVTEHVLQDLYPPGPSAQVHAVSDAVLSLSELTLTPRQYAAPARRLITVGSQDQTYKGHEDLLHAFSIARDCRPDLHLTLVGDGRLKERLQELARSLRIEDSVAFAGRINDRDKLLALLDESDVFVLPSHTEGLPRALIEAMARALPAVSTSVGGVPELLPPGHLVPPHDPKALARRVLELMDSPDHLTTASADSIQRAEAFTRDHTAKDEASWIATLRALGARVGRSTPA